MLSTGAIAITAEAPVNQARLYEDGVVDVLIEYLEKSCSERGKANACRSCCI